MTEKKRIFLVFSTQMIKDLYISANINGCCADLNHSFSMSLG